MQRRTLITGTAAVSAAALLRLPTTAQDASPEATPEGTDFELTTEGLVATVEREYETDSLRVDGAIVFDLVTYVYESDENAADAFKESDGYYDFFVAQAALEGGSLTEREELSSPDLGADRIAETFDIESDGVTINTTTFRAYDGRTLHMWLAAGLADPSVELLELVEQLMTFEPEGESDEDIYALLPELQDMPPGFTLSKEEIRRDEP